MDGDRVTVLPEVGGSGFDLIQQQMGEAAFLRRKGRKLAATALAKSKPRPVGTIKRVGERRGRNELCPCGSLKKFKRCCGDFRGEG